MADSVAKLAQNSDVFSGVEDAANFSELVAKNFANAGKNQSEVANLMNTINLSMSRGEANSRMMLQLFRDAPETVNMLARSFGVSTARLEEMAGKGEISAQALKNAFIKNADSINAKYGNLSFSISDALSNIRNQWGLFVAETDDKFKITQSIAQFMVNGFTKFINVLRKVRDWVGNVADKLGGMQNLLKLIGVAAGGIFLALNAGKILGFLKSVLGFLNPMGLKTLLIAGFWILLLLAIEDVWNFMQGNDSVLGAILENMGIDAEEFREKIKGVWNSIKNTAAAIWEGIKIALYAIWGGIAKWWDKHGSGIGTDIMGIFNGVLDFLTGIFTGDWELAWNGLCDIAIGLIDGIARAIDALIPNFYNAVVSVQYNWKKTFGSKEEAAEFEKENWNYLYPDATQTWEEWNASGGDVAGKNTFDYVKGVPLPRNMHDVLFDEDYKQALMETGNYEKLAPLLQPAEPVKNIWNFWKDFWFGDKNDKGGGTTGRFASGTNYTPDTFIAGEHGAELIAGAKGRKVFTAEKTREIFEMLSGFAKMADPALSGAAKMQTLQTSHNNVTNRTINQNNYFESTFNGDRDIQEKASSAADKMNDDFTEVLTRALQFS